MFNKEELEEIARKLENLLEYSHKLVSVIKDESIDKTRILVDKRKSLGMHHPEVMQINSECIKLHSFTLFHDAFKYLILLNNHNVGRMKLMDENADRMMTSIEGLTRIIQNIINNKD